MVTLGTNIVAQVYGRGSPILYKALMALSCFIVGSIGSNIVGFVGCCLPCSGPSAASRSGSASLGRKRWRLFLVFIGQALFILVAAALTHAQIISSRLLDGDKSKGLKCFSAGHGGAKACGLVNWWDLLAVGLLALDGAFQVATSRMLPFPDLATTGMSTLTWDQVHGHRILGSDVRDARQSAREGHGTFWQQLFSINGGRVKRQLYRLVSFCLYFGSICLAAFFAQLMEEAYKRAEQTAVGQADGDKKGSLGPLVGLWSAMAIKLVQAVMIVFWPKASDDSAV